MLLETVEELWWTVCELRSGIVMVAVEFPRRTQTWGLHKQNKYVITYKVPVNGRVSLRLSLT